MDIRKTRELIHFLREELAVPASGIDLALKHTEQPVSQLPIVLWNYGLVTLSQLSQIFDWLEQWS
jgi:hypothetical protein